MANPAKNLFSFFICFILILITACQGKNEKKYERQIKSLSSHIGEKFELSNIIDSSGKQIELDFKRSEITIIDLWFNECPPCIEEMKQFAEILTGKGKKVSIISISINNFNLWKKTLVEHSNRFSFLNNKVSNWIQYNLQSNEAEKLKNDIPFDRQAELVSKYNVAFFPAFFVVDQEGIIKTRPVSAVKFIKELN